MRRFILFLICLVTATPAGAQMSYEDEARALGAVAGQGLACGSQKYGTFEMLARAILLTKSPSDELMDKGLKIYLEEKADVFVSKQLDNFADCRSIVAKFDAQDIFKATLYGDGTIKMPDGQILTPRNPYDASQIYDKNANDFQRANSIYRKDTSKIKKVEFKDASMEAGNQIRPHKASGNSKKILTTPRRISRNGKK